MSIQARSKMQNVKASIEKYIYDNLVLTEGLVIDWEGVPFESEQQLEWVQERIIGTGDRDFHRQVGGGSDLGQTTEILLSFNCFVNRDNSTKVLRHYELRDKIYNYFHINKDIPLYDYTQDDFTNILDYLRVCEIETDSVIPNLDLRQYNLTVVLHWTEAWSK